MAKENKSQEIIHLDGRDMFLDVTDVLFFYGKVKFIMKTYDQSKARGDRITSEAQCYLSFAECLTVLKLFESGYIRSLSKEANQNNQTGYPKAAYVVQGGSKANGAPIFRSFSIYQNKDKWKIELLECEGVTGRTGGFSPKKGAPQKRISMNFTIDKIFEIFCSIEKRIDVFNQVRYGDLRYKTMFKKIGVNNIIGLEEERLSYMDDMKIDPENV